MEVVWVSGQRLHEGFKPFSQERLAITGMQPPSLLYMCVLSLLLTSARLRSSMGPHQVQPPDLALPSFRSVSLNNPLFYIMYPVSNIPLKMDS